AATPAGTPAQPAQALTIEPVAGPFNSQNLITIRGGSFADRDQVTVGGAPISAKFDPAGTLSVTIPAVQKPGRVDVVVLRAGVVVATVPGGYAYVDQMTISGIQPGSGSVLGCDTAAIAGNGFVDGM